jgi:iron complex transport system permease protein
MTVLNIGVVLNKAFVFGAALAILLVVLFFLDISLGSVYVPLSDILKPRGIYGEIIRIIRLPQAVGAVIIGADLAVAGATMQAVFRNPLADPYITGTASGAVLGVLLGMVMLFLFHIKAVIYIEPAFGFAGAMLATLMVIIAGGKNDKMSIILAGISVSVLFSALVMIMDSYVLTISPSFISVIYALFGTLSGLNWNVDTIIATISIPALAYVALSGKRLNLIMMSDEIAQSSGISPGHERLRALAASGVLTAVSLSFTGIIGFVGLITPHMVRLSIGDADNRKVIPLAALLGASVLSFSNFASKMLIHDVAVPITAITSLIGAPVMIYLIRKGRSIGN